MATARLGAGLGEPRLRDRLMPVPLTSRLAAVAALPIVVPRVEFSEAVLELMAF